MGGDMTYTSEAQIFYYLEHDEVDRAIDVLERWQREIYDELIELYNERDAMLETMDELKKSVENGRK